MKGSSFNSFLRDENLLVETTALAAKRIFSRQVTKVMQAIGNTKNNVSSCARFGYEFLLSVAMYELQGLAAASSIQLFFLMPYARCQAESRDGWMKRDTEMTQIAASLRKELDEVEAQHQNSITISREEYRQLTKTKKYAKRALKAIDNEDIVQAGIELRPSKTGLKAISREGEK